MLYRIFLIVSGVLLLLFGAVIALDQVAAIKVAENYKLAAIDLCLLLSVVFLAVAGIPAILTGITQKASILSFTNRYGMQLVTFSLVLIAGFVFSSQSAALSPFFETLASKLKLSGDVGKLSMISVLVLAFVIWLFHSGIMLAENWAEIDAYVIVHQTTLLFVGLIVVPLCYAKGLLIIPEKISAFTLMAFTAWGIFIFMRPRVFARSSAKALKLGLLTMLSVVLLAAYWFIVTKYLYGFAAKIPDGKTLGKLIPIVSFILTVIALLFVGFEGNHPWRTIGYFKCKGCGIVTKGRFQYCSETCRQNEVRRREEAKAQQQAAAQKSAQAWNKVKQGSGGGAGGDGSKKCPNCGQMAERLGPGCYCKNCGSVFQG